MTNESDSILSGKTLQDARERERLSVLNAILSLVLSIVVLVLVITTGASSALRDVLNANASIFSKALFVLIFSALSSLLSFPLSFYFGYTVQKRFGLLKQGLGGWLLDFMKQFAVGTLISTILFTVLYAIFAAFPATWLPISAAAIALFFGAILFLQPTLVRLNYKALPLENPELEARVKSVFDRAGVRLSKVSKLMMSEKTKTMNAALLPDGLGTEVIMGDTLISALEPDGVDVVLAHELGHRVHRDIPKLMALGFAQFLVTLVIAYAFFQTSGMQFGLGGAPDIATLPIFLLCFAVVGEVWGLLTNYVMRRAEYAADQYALEITQNPTAFERAFRVLATENLSDPNPPAWVEFWLHNHPSIEKRIAAARAWSADQRVSGVAS